MTPHHVVLARAWIGTPYVHQASCRGGGCDCLGLLRGVWREALGEEPEAVPPYSADWSEPQGDEALLRAAARHMRRRAWDCAEVARSGAGGGAAGRFGADRCGTGRVATGEVAAGRVEMGQVGTGQVGEGDVLLFRMRAGGVAKHLGIAARRGRDVTFIHAYQGHGVVESALTEPWRRRIAACFVFPERKR